MCIVCVELIKQQMTITEAEKNLGELVSDRKASVDEVIHYGRLKEAIEDLDLDYLDVVLNEGSEE